MLHFIILNIRIKHESERMALAPFYWWEAETANQQMKKMKTKETNSKVGHLTRATKEGW